MRGERIGCVILPTIEFFIYAVCDLMYSRNLFNLGFSGYIFLELLLLSRRTHRVHTAKTSLFNKNISLKTLNKRFLEYILW